jgi:glutamate 5-kinase
MAICHGAALRPLSALHGGANATWFTATLDPQAARKRWISAMKPCGTVTIDAGAMQALSKGNSLLPAGVHVVSGTFGRGDPVAINGPDGHQLGLGLSRYTAIEAQQIKGHQSAEIEALLGYPGRAALIHRDDMAL